jgi:prophage tail gpP-like protein
MSEDGVAVVNLNDPNEIDIDVTAKRDPPAVNPPPAPTPDPTPTVDTSPTPDATTPAVNNDIVTIIANNQSITGWQEISITRSIESFPSSFNLGFTEYYPNVKEIIITPGTAASVKIGNDLILTGYIDQYNSNITAESHDVRINGRSKCEDLIDCSALFSESVQAAGQNITELATMLAKPFGITVKNFSDDGPGIPSITINLGETPYEIIEKIARWIGLLVYDDVNGNLVLSRVGLKTMAGGFSQGTNIQSASGRFQVDQRFTDYYVVWQSVDTQADINNNSNTHGHATDEYMKGLGRVRPHYIVSSLTDATLGAGFDLGQRIADWENNRRIGRSQSITLVTDTWRDKSGALWEPNSLIYVDVPKIKIADKTWVIATVTYKRNLDSGTTAELILMPPLAFSIEPSSLGGIDADTMRGIQKGTSSPPENLNAREGLA